MITSCFCTLLLQIGIGGMTALKLIRQHGSIEKILENINKERCMVHYMVWDWFPYFYIIQIGFIISATELSRLLCYHCFIFTYFCSPFSFIFHMKISKKKFMKILLFSFPAKKNKNYILVYCKFFL